MRNDLPTSSFGLETESKYPGDLGSRRGLECLLGLVRFQIEQTDALERATFFALVLGAVGHSNRAYSQ
uniref:Uncharacterized protein n=1 Tax=Utricularia reniformis TaxID=192314 RepID=A0A1Y0B0I2_9LAMI|nr:hypothetical protein AEK19_MT0646 [Utricularia reniformis]ART30899.1 hypothetical protein AEK19_MT0646 [Utricularia reniformis]